MNRDDAQEAMDAYQDSDPLRTGRRMVLRWGKNVKKSVKRGTGGVPIPPIKKATAVDFFLPQGVSTGVKIDQDYIAEQQRKKRREDDFGPSSEKLDSNFSNKALSTHIQISAANMDSSFLVSNEDKSIKVQQRSIVETPVYNPEKHAANAIRVITPSNPTRLRFITTVSSFVAKDGSVLEKRLIERESNNPAFLFLMPLLQDSIQDQVDMNERIFYRWRVFAFLQGDGFDSWRTEPFIMIDGGRFWIPPSLDAEAARREEMQAKKKEEYIRSQQEVRRQLAGKKEFMTGRQLEHAKFGGSRTAASDGAAVLNSYEMGQWKDIIEKKLCASNEAICETMAFCFDKSGAAKQISELLKEALMDDRPGVSVETRIARLYLMSDILFNSQQPGVKNAFRYRDAIEAMAPGVFQNFGQHGQGFAGRMTMNKLRNAVRAVLSAWASWSVYNIHFLDELQAKFEGVELLPSAPKEKEVILIKAKLDALMQETGTNIIPEEDDGEDKTSESNEIDNVQAPRSQWVEAKDLDEESESLPLQFMGRNDYTSAIVLNIEDHNEANCQDELGNKILDDDYIDGEELLDDDIDGEELLDDDIDGEELFDDDIDGEDLDGEDLDGEDLNKSTMEPL